MNTNSREITLDILPNGDISFIEKTETIELSDHGETDRRRVSRVEPCSFFLRVAFYAIRSVVKDTSAIAEWTRTWSCLWRFRMLDDHFTSSTKFKSRAAAIEAEVEYFHNRNKYKYSNG